MMQFFLMSLGLLGTVFNELASAVPQAYTSNPYRFKFYTLPEALSGPCDLCTGPDKAIWVQNIFSDTIARIDPQTGLVEEYPIPYTYPLPTSGFIVFPGLGGRTDLACAIRSGSDGNIYAASGIRNQLVRIVPSTREITVLGPNPPNEFGNLLNFNDMWTGPSGMFFSQTTANVVTYYHYETGVFQNFDSPTPLSGPLGMRIYTGDGDLWFTEFFAGKIARLNFTTGAIKEYPLPLPGMGPSVLRVQEKNILWFVLLLGNGLGRINTDTGKIDLFISPQPLEVPAEEAADLEGNIWFSAFFSNTLNYFNPTTETFHTVTLPGGGAADQRLPADIPIAIHYYGPTNTMWFTLAGTNQVGYYILDTK